MSRKCLSVRDVDVSGKKVLVRGDFDVENGDNPRVRSVIEIVKYLQDNKAKHIRVIGHRETNYPICEELRKRFENVEFDDTIRQNPGEKTNDMEYARKLAADFDVYINEAFATSHRVHSSIVSVPKVIKEKGGQVGVGLRFEIELEKLKEIWDREGRRILVIGGTKIEDKQRFAQDMKDKFAAVLKGGKLPGVITRPDGLDISEDEINRFEAEIAQAEVILAAGVMGKYEDTNASEGTRRVLTAIANNTKAYKIAGGGDIEAAITSFGLTDKFDWISVGGGAMLEYLSKGTLPGLEAVET